ncbi:ABC transporter ATP-binding protein [Mycoplasmopsis pullorum]|nr:ABC transporter ATP-binding protein [Mycoplasmopsis pullorum]
MRENKYIKKDKKLKTLKKIYSFIPFSKGTWFWVVTLLISLSLFESFTGWLIGYIFDKFFNQNTIGENFETIKYFIFIGFLILAYVLLSFFEWIHEKIIGPRLTKFPYQLRQELYKKIQAMPISFFENEKTGDLMSSITEDTDNLSEAINSIILDYINVIFTFSITLTLMFLYAPILAALTLVILPITSLFFFKIILKGRKFFRKNRMLIGELNGYVEEIVDALPLIRIHQQQEKILEDFKRLNEKQALNQFRGSIYWSLSGSAYSIMKVLNQLVVISIGAFFLINNYPSYGITGQISLGLLTSFSIYVSTMTDQFSKILDFSNQIQNAISSWERIERILDLKPDQDQSQLGTLNFKRGDIRFNDVFFAYPKNPETKVLKNINFSIPSGKSLALVGHTGCGKTTVSKLLSKFYIPTEGTITIDDQEIREINESSWRENIAIINQEIFLFEDTIMNNLKIVNNQITDEEIIKICQLTKADKFIQKLEKGYQTVITHNGENLSQGQRQLLSITRAIISKKSIIIMDEATSNIDTITEKYIQEALNYLMDNKTMLIIAHRLSTIKNCDNILVLSKGEIIESGTHQELMSNSESYYAQLYKIGFENL